MDILTKNAKRVESTTKIVSAVFKTHMLKRIQQYTNVYFVARITKKKKFDKQLKQPFLNTFKFSNYDINKLNLLLRKGVFTHLNIGKNPLRKKIIRKKIFIGKNPLKCDYLKSKTFTVT